MRRPEILIAHHPGVTRGTIEIHEVDGIEEVGRVVIGEKETLRFLTECIGEDLFSLGIIRMIIASGKQALIVKHPEEEVPGL